MRKRAPFMLLVLLLVRIELPDALKPYCDFDSSKTPQHHCTAPKTFFCPSSVHIQKMLTLYHQQCARSWIEEARRTAA